MWEEHFLVLGDFSCSILLCNLGAVSCPTEFNLYLVYTFSSLWIKFNNMVKDVYLDSQVNNVSVTPPFFWVKRIGEWVDSNCLNRRFCNLWLLKISYMKIKRFVSSTDIWLYWSSYFTNTLILPAFNGPTEGLMLIYLSHFFTAIVGKILLLSCYSLLTYVIWKLILKWHRSDYFFLSLLRFNCDYTFLLFQVLSGGLNHLESLCLFWVGSLF